MEIILKRTNLIGREEESISYWSGNVPLKPKDRFFYYRSKNNLCEISVQNRCISVIARGENKNLARSKAQLILRTVVSAAIKRGEIIIDR